MRQLPLALRRGTGIRTSVFTFTHIPEGNFLQSEISREKFPR
jgi:hypothetical protein